MCAVTEWGAAGMFAPAEPHSLFLFESNDDRLVVRTNMCIITKGLSLRQSAGTPAVSARFNGNAVG